MLKPGGRLVVGELMGDPHYVTFNSLRRARRGRRPPLRAPLGAALGFFARFAKPRGGDEAAASVRH